MGRLLASEPISGHGWVARTRDALPSMLLWPVIAYLCGFYLLPVLQMLSLSVTEPDLGLGNFRQLIEVSYYGRVALTTFQISVSVALLSLAFGYPIALFVVSRSGRWRGLFLVAVIVPFFTSLLVRNYAWIFLLGTQGVINTLAQQAGLIDEPLPLMFNRFGVMVGMTHIMLPYAVLILISTLTAIPPRLTHAASSLGAGAFTVFRRVLLPLSLPGAGAAFTITFVLSIAFFVTPAMLGSPRDYMIANIIASEIGFLNWGMGATLSLVLVVITLVAVALAQTVFGGLSALAPGFGGSRTVRRRRAGALEPAWRRIDRLLDPIWSSATACIGVGGLVFLVIPVLILFPLALSTSEYFMFPPPGYSLKWFEAYFADPRWTAATLNSFKIAFLTVALVLALAVPAALALARSSSRLSTVIYLLIISPMVVPSIVIAISLLFLFTRFGLDGTVVGVALGHTVTALPLAVIVLLAALKTFDWNLERAAMSLGANRFRATVKVVLPAIGGSVATAAFLAFLHSFDELLVALFVSGIRAETLPKKMWESLQEIDPTIAAVSSLLVTLTVLVLAGSHGLGWWIERKRARRQ